MVQRFSCFQPVRNFNLEHFRTEKVPRMFKLKCSDSELHRSSSKVHLNKPNELIRRHTFSFSHFRFKIKFSVYFRSFFNLKNLQSFECSEFRAHLWAFISCLEGSFNKSESEVPKSSRRTVFVPRTVMLT